MGSTVECERYERPASRRDAHPSLSNHETDLTSMIRAAYMQRHRFPVTGGAAPMARAANTRDAASTPTGAMIGSINGSPLGSYFTRLIEVRVALRIFELRS